MAMLDRSVQRDEAKKEEGGGGGGGVGDVVNIGKFVWDIMKDNAPTSTATTDSANAIPAGTDPLTMNLPDPRPRTVNITYTSDHIWGSNATTVNMACLWNFNAQSSQTPGQYLLNARVNVTDQDIGWGSKVTITVKARSPFGTGNPKVAVLPIDVIVQEHTLSSDVASTVSVQLEGNGAGG
jgi:hypothetical protein